MLETAEEAHLQIAVAIKAAVLRQEHGERHGQHSSIGKPRLSVTSLVLWERGNEQTHA